MLLCHFATLRNWQIGKVEDVLEYYSFQQNASGICKNGTSGVSKGQNVNSVNRHFGLLILLVSHF